MELCQNLVLDNLVKTSLKVCKIEHTFKIIKQHCQIYNYFCQSIRTFLWPVVSCTK